MKAEWTGLSKNLKIFIQVPIISLDVEAETTDSEASP